MTSGKPQKGNKFPEGHAKIQRILRLIKSQNGNVEKGGTI